MVGTLEKVGQVNQRYACRTRILFETTYRFRGLAGFRAEQLMSDLGGTKVFSIERASDCGGIGCWITAEQDR